MTRTNRGLYFKFRSNCDLSGCTSRVRKAVVETVEELFILSFSMLGYNLFILTKLQLLAIIVMQTEYLQWSSEIF